MECKVHSWDFTRVEEIAYQREKWHRLQVGVKLMGLYFIWETESSADHCSSHHPAISTQELVLERKMQASKLPFFFPEEFRYSLEVCYANTTCASLMSYDVQGGRMQQMFESGIAEKYRGKGCLPKRFIHFP